MTSDVIGALLLIGAVGLRWLLRRLGVWQVSRFTAALAFAGVSLTTLNLLFRDHTVSDCAIDAGFWLVWVWDLITRWRNRDRRKWAARLAGYKARAARARLLSRAREVDA